ncbi:tigger transposable element-derived protein 6-like [Rhizophagus irregularis DAOM 181602=DAOM 197198]|nr:tigger transposable element-derived protein 6-like [Rhizophagus irregularis DAOM 181602=DAOM 197198]
MPKAKPINLSKKQLSKETSAPKKRKSLTAAQKQEVCLKKKSSPFLKNKDLAKEYDVSEGMICDILKTKDRWLAVDLYSYQAGLRRERKLPFIVIEEALALWVENALQAGLIISDDILSIKALEFAFLCNEEKFKGSDGWIDKFKKRHNLKQYNMHGEAASAPLAELDTMRENLCQILKNYDPNDIFNCDETGLFWKMRPNHTISNGLVAGTKQSKDRIMVLFTCNATGTEKLRPLFIHKYENPWALKNINKTTLPVNYYWNSKSWMQAQYRKLLLRNRVKAFDNYNEFGINPVEINIKKCIKYVARAWNNVTQSTIENCWLKADILPKDNESEIDMDFCAETQVLLTHTNELKEVQDLIDKLNLENPLTADEFIQCDESELTAEMISNEEILKVVLPNNHEQEVEELNSDPLPSINHSEAIEHYDKVILYLEQQEDKFDMKKEEIRCIKKLRKEALKQHFISARQTNLNDFINIS